MVWLASTTGFGKIVAILWKLVCHGGKHQIRKNAFFSNWLKTTGDVPYQHYPERRLEFSQQLGHLEEFFREEQVGQVEPTSWNVTYVNHIDYKGLEYVAPEVARTLTGLDKPVHAGHCMNFP